MIIKTLTTLALVVSCLGFEREESFRNYENDTIVDLFLRSMKLSDYLRPSVDRLGVFKRSINDFFMFDK
jgi:hypothetical protein